ncbi:monocarboxylate transporter 4-like [Ciona intestinalis]
MAEEKGLSKGNAFLIVACAFWVNAMIMGPVKSTGVYFLPYQQNYKANAQQASLVSSLLYGFYFFAGPLASISCHLIGYKYTSILGSVLASVSVAVSCLSQTMDVLFVTMGALFGLGSCLAMTPVYALLGQIFTDKRPLVNNIVTIGSAVSGIPLSLTVQLWLDEYGLAGSMLLMSGVLLNSLPAILALMVMGEKSNISMSAAKKKVFDFNILKNSGFTFFCLASGLHIASTITVCSYLIRFAQSIGIGNYEAASLSSIMAAIDICLRPITGYLTSLSHIGNFQINRFYVIIWSLILQSAVTVIFAFATNYAAMIAATIAFSICAGATGALPITLLAELFGSENLATSLGLRSMFVGVFSLATPPLVGMIVDATGSYVYPFYVSTALAFLSSSMFYLVFRCCGPTDDAASDIVTT